MKLRRKLFAAVSSLAVASAVLLTGCGAPAQEGTALKETGTLTLSVNPEIQIEYNREGKVTDLTGRNDDGKTIVAAYPDYIGKNCEVVLQDLIVEINEAGFFVDDIDGNKKNIVLQLEPGSVLPSDDFLEDMSLRTQETVKGLDLASGIVTIDDDDYDPAYAKDGKPSPYITLEKAQEIALTQANVNAADAVFDLEFMANGNEYEYDIHAVTGKVVKAEHKTAGTQSGTPATGSGSTNYNDTDYGPNNDGVTDYNDTDYGPNNDGVTDYNDTDYGPNNDGVTDYNDTNYDDHGNTNYGDTNYDDGGSDYDRESDDNWDDGDSGYDD